MLEQRYIDYRSRDFALLDALVLAKHGGPLYENPTKFGRGDQKELLSVAVFVYVVFLPLFIVCEAARVIGGGRVWRLFSARPTAADASAIEEFAESLDPCFSYAEHAVDSGRHFSNGR